MGVLLARDEHIESIYHIEKTCFGDPWSENSIREAIHNANHYVIVFFEDDIIKGYAGMYYVCSEGYVNNIAVLPEFRGNKIGSMLMENLVDYSLQNKLEFLSLEVRASNLSAINLYSNFGFKNVGERKNFYVHPSEDAIIMTKWLK